MKRDLIKHIAGLACCLLLAMPLARGERQTVIAADPNADGAADMIFIDREAGVVRTVLNNGSGTLAEIATRPTVPAGNPVGLSPLVGTPNPRFVAFDRTSNSASLIEFSGGNMNLIQTLDVLLVGGTGVDGVNVAGQLGVFSIVNAQTREVRVFEGIGGAIIPSGITPLTLGNAVGFNDQCDALMTSDAKLDLVILSRRIATGTSVLTILEERAPVSVVNPWMEVVTRNLSVQAHTRMVRLVNGTNREEVALWTPGNFEIVIVGFDAALNATAMPIGLAQPVRDLRAAKLRGLTFDDVAVLYADGQTIETFERSGTMMTSIAQTNLSDGGKPPIVSFAWGKFTSAAAAVESVAVLRQSSSDTEIAAGGPFSVSVYANNGTGMISGTATSSTDLAELPAVDPANPNVVFLLGGALTAITNPSVVAAQKVPGYTTVVTIPYNGAQVTVGRLDPNPATGFGALGDAVVNQVLPGAAGQYTVSLNQLAADLSAYYMGDPGVFDPLNVLIAPASGLYQEAIQVQLSAKTATTTIRYSVNSGPWLTYTDPIPLTTNAVVEYNGMDGPQIGPTKTAVYLFDIDDCKDSDGDKLPDFIEVLLGQNPTIPESDVNENGVEDFDEVIRGSLLTLPAVIAPEFVDSDGDGWSDYDEGLRATAAILPDHFPVAPNLNTVEQHRTGEVFPTAPGASAPPGSPAPVPDPPAFAITVLSPTGEVTSGTSVMTAPNFEYRAAGDRFHYAEARAQDGTGRVLLALVPPEGLCLDPANLCPAAKTLPAWRAAFKAEYEPKIYDLQTNSRIDPRTTAEALLLNRYYELNDEEGRSFAPGVAGAEVPKELVLALRAKRNEGAFFTQIQAAVTTEMIDVCADMYRFRGVPAGRQMAVILADIFAGRPTAAGELPDGFRAGNVPTVAAQTAAFLASIGDGTTILSGPVAVSGDGFVIMDTNSAATYRLINLAETIVPGQEMTLRCIIDIDNCQFPPLPARVVEIINVSLIELAMGANTDGDCMADEWELIFFGNLDQGSDDNPDMDDMTNCEEYQKGFDPTIADGPYNSWMPH